MARIDTGRIPAGAGGRTRPAPRGYLEWAKIALLAFTLNAIWLCGCALVLTAPASTTALFAALRRWRGAAEPPTIGQFVRDVGRSLWRDLIIGMLLAAVVAFFVGDLMIIGRMDGAGRRVMLTLWIACAVIVLIGSVRLFSVAAGELIGPGRRRPTVTIAESVRQGFGHPVHSIAAILVVGAAAMLVSVSPICLLGVGVGGVTVLDLIAYGSNGTGSSTTSQNTSEEGSGSDRHGPHHDS